MRIRAHAPGRVNLIGDHTDYAGGLALPLAIDMGTTVLGEKHGDRVVLRSHQQDDPAMLPLTIDDPSDAEPPWARYVAGVIAELAPSSGFVGIVDSTLPIGAGLSSSAALEVAVALALGFEGSARDLAQLCQRAEQRASGVPCGLMDQLASACGRQGHAMLIDFAALDIDYIAMPADAEVVVLHSGENRALTESAYDERRADTEAGSAIVGPLRDLPVERLIQIDDPVVRRRARHVVTENDRVLRVAAALRANDLETVGELMVQSHASLRDDFEVSTASLDALVERLVDTAGVFGARLTGAGFGGCVVAFCREGCPARRRLARSRIRRGPRGRALGERARHAPVRSVALTKNCFGRYRAPHPVGAPGTHTRIQGHSLSEPQPATRPHPIPHIGGSESDRRDDEHDQHDHVSKVAFSSARSRSIAPGVRRPHQNRSLPSTNTTGATASSSGR